MKGTPSMWEPNEIRVLRWFMRCAGVALAIPGVIYLLSWPDTLRAFAPLGNQTLAGIAAGFSVAALFGAGLTFLLARFARPGAILGALSLILGGIIHYRWSVMLSARLAILPEGLSDADHAMLEDTILFAANAQIPHILKNLVLVGVCLVVFLLAPTLCGTKLERPR